MQLLVGKKTCSGSLLCAPPPFAPHIKAGFEYGWAWLCRSPFPACSYGFWHQDWPFALWNGNNKYGTFPRTIQHVNNRNVKSSVRAGVGDGDFYLIHSHLSFTAAWCERWVVNTKKKNKTNNTVTVIAYIMLESQVTKERRILKKN